MIKRIVLITLVVVSNLQSMEIIKPNNIFLNMLPNQNRIRVPQEFATQSILIKLLQECFKDKGTKANPFEVILNPSIAANTFKKFIAGALAQDIIEQTKFLWLAHYFDMPVAQHQHEYALRKKFKKCSPLRAISSIEHLTTLNLLLPTSFYNTLLGSRLTKLFVVTHSVTPCDQLSQTVSDNQLVKQKIFESRIDLIEEEYNICRENTKFYLSTTGTILALSAVCSDTSYLVYVSETLPEPVILDYPDDTQILLYTPSPQANKIVSCDSNRTLIVWDRLKDTPNKEINNWQKTIIATNMNGYENIIFSDDGDLFITLEKTSLQTITIKVWDAYINQVIAYYISPHYHITLTDFFMNNTQVILHTYQGESEVFSIQQQSLLQKVNDKMLKNRWRKDLELRKSDQEKYYIIKRPSILYNQYHNRLIGLSPTALYFDLTQSLHARFNSSNTILLRTCNPDSQCFEFDIKSLDTILEEINKLTPSQAVALFFVSKILHAKRKKNKLKEKNHSSEINHTIKKPLSIRHQKTIEFLKKELSRLTGPLKDLLDAA